MGRIPKELVDFMLTTLLGGRRLSFLRKGFIERSKVHGKSQTQVNEALASTTHLRGHQRENSHMLELLPEIYSLPLVLYF